MEKEIISVELKKVWKRYSETRWVLQGVELVARSGEKIVVLGSNGSGKTTLLKIIAGLLKPSKGTVLVYNTPPYKSSARMLLGVVLDHILLYKEFTVRENLLYYSKLYGVRGFDPDSYWVVDVLGLGKYLDKRVGELSYGWRRRADIARSLIHNPRVLLIDEVFSGLDERGVESLSSVIEEYSRSGATVILASPQKQSIPLLREAEVYMLVDGRLIRADPRLGGSS